MAVVNARLALRMKNVATLSTAIKAQALVACITPEAMVTAGCAGFMLAEWMHKPAHDPEMRRSQAPMRAYDAKKAVMNKAAMLLKLAYDLNKIRTKAHAVGENS